MEETLTGQIVVVWCGSRSGEWFSGNRRSWNIYLSQKWGTTCGKMKIINVSETVQDCFRNIDYFTDVRFTPKIQHKVSDSCLPVFDVTIHYSCYDEWWRCIYAKLYHMMWLCGNNQLHSTVFKGTSNKHWNTERTTSIIKRKMVSSKWHCK